MTQETGSPQTHTSDAQLAVLEIDSAATFALESSKFVDGAVTPKAANESGEERTPMTSAERAQVYQKRVTNQKKKGKAELERVYTGAIALPFRLTVNDINVASSAERFVGLIDRALYTISRRGVPILGAAGAEKVLTKLEEMIGEYAEHAKAAHSQADALLIKEREATFDAADWLEPTYACSALDVSMLVKSPITIRLVRAIKDWDEALFKLDVLGWNGKVDNGQAPQLRSEERREHFAIFRFAVRSVIGLRNQLNGNGNKTDKPEDQPQSLAIAA